MIEKCNFLSPQRLFIWLIDFINIVFAEGVETLQMLKQVMEQQHSFVTDSSSDKEETIVMVGDHPEINVEP